MAVTFNLFQKTGLVFKGALWAVSILFGSAAAAFANDQEEVFAALLENLQTIQTSDFGKLQKVTANLRMIGASIRNLQARSVGREIPSNYLSQLELNAHALQLVAEAVAEKSVEPDRNSNFKRYYPSKVVDDGPRPPKRPKRSTDPSYPPKPSTETWYPAKRSTDTSYPPKRSSDTPYTPKRQSAESSPSKRTSERRPAERHPSQPNLAPYPIRLRPFTSPTPSYPTDIHLFQAFFLSPQSAQQGWNLGKAKSRVFVSEALGANQKAQLIQILDDVRLDLSDKVSFANRNPADPFSFVKIKVTTRNKLKTEISGYEVWFSPKVLFDDNHQDAHFDEPSSPTAFAVPPGNYVFWAKRGSAHGPAKHCKDVGVDGLTERLVDPLFIP